MESSVSYSKIDIASLPYSSCADLIALTDNECDVVRNRNDVKLVVQNRPPGIPRPIAGVPSRQDEMAGRFSGKPPSLANTPSSVLRSILVEELLPTPQNSPVHHSGE